MPLILFQIALIIIAVRSIYVLVQGDLRRNDWLNAAYHAAIALVCVYALF